MTLRNKIKGIGEIWQFTNRWQLLFNRLFFSREHIHIYRYKGLEILVDHAAGDANGAREILTSDMYRQFLSGMDLEGDLNILDLGSNNGGFPLLVCSENKTIKKLVCVEFNPNTFSRMRFNIERNLAGRFVPVNAAVCGQKREFNRAFGGGGTSESIYADSPVNTSNSIKIKGLTFNELYQENFLDEIIDICKMDIEGAEFEVFTNSGCSQISKCRYLLIEIHHEPDRPREIVREKLTNLGFAEVDPESKSDEFHHVHFFVNKQL